MAKIVFFGIPAYGHTNPTLPLIAELVRSGDEVVYYSTITFRDKIEATGATFKEYRNSALFDTTNPGKNLGLLFYVLTSVTYGLLDELIADVTEIGPDFLIHDATCLWGRYVATICKIPAISSVSTFAFSKKGVGMMKSCRFILSIGWKGLVNMAKAQAVQKKLEMKYGIKASGFLETMMNEEGLNIVYTSKLFQPHSEEFDADAYKFVGPSISERSDDPDTADYSLMAHPLVYVSFGTIWKDEGAIDAVIDTLSGLGYILVVSSPGNNERQPGNSRIIIKSHVNQLEVLKYCDAFMTHGGMNSVSEALYREVPMCIHPFQPEQEGVARRVVDLGAGVLIKKFTKEEIRRSVTSLIGEKKYKENCRRIAVSLKEAGGFRKAAEYIKAYAKAKS